MMHLFDLEWETALDGVSETVLLVFCFYLSCFQKEACSEQEPETSFWLALIQPLLWTLDGGGYCNAVFYFPC